MGGTGSRVIVQAALDALERAGLSSDAVLRESGLSRVVVEQPDARFPLENALALWEHAARAAGDPFFGLHVAAALPAGYGVLDYLLCASATLRDGLHRLAHYAPIANDRADLRALDAPAELRLVRSPDRAGRQWAEFLFSFMVARGRADTAVDWAPCSMTFAHAPPDDPEPARAFFRCPVTWGAPSSELVLDARTAALPLVSASSPLLAVMLEYAERLMAGLPTSRDLVAQVRAAIARALPASLPTADEIAAELKTSSRTLQRRLRERGTTYLRIVDEVRHDLALRYLANASLSIGEVSFLLHFAEVPSFTRAFKRWTRRSPREHRMRLFAAPAPA